MNRYTIKEIRIFNLKHFRGEFTIVLEGKNLLLFGENGSGKSSIFWTLHMFYQSCLKTPDSTGAGKYFDPDNSQNLRNAFADRGAKSGVEITFQSDGTSSDKQFHDTNIRIDTAPTETDKFMRFSLQTSDFMSYKSLATLYDFRNSQLCDLTKLFEREIFPSMDFSVHLRDLNGVDLNKTNISDWWNAIISYPSLLPCRSINSKVYVVNCPEYEQYSTIIRDFNLALASHLDEISLRANRILREDFHVLYGVNLECGEVKFNQIIRKPGSKRSYRDNKLTLPQIILKMEWKDALLPSADHKIWLEHPQSFFNEAKLTIAAFAIRLAIIEMKYSGATECAPILCVDDLLISLDMGNRIPIAERILKCANDYQMFIFTHDHSLYELFTRLLTKEEKKEKWLLKELYNVLDDMNNPSSLNPHLCDNNSYLIKARMLWHKHELPSAVNCLRKAAESILYDLLPENMRYMPSFERTTLKFLLTQVPKFVTLYSLPSNPIMHVDYFRSRLLNPLSHDDFSSPVYSQELKLCIQELSELAQYKKKTIVEGRDITTTVFLISLVNGPASITVDFKVIEKWDYCYINDAGSHYYKNVEVKVTNSSDTTVVANNFTSKLLDLYKVVYISIGYSELSAPILDHVIIRASDGKYLHEL